MSIELSQPKGLPSISTAPIIGKPLAGLIPGSSVERSEDTDDSVVSNIDGEETVGWVHANSLG